MYEDENVIPWPHCAMGDDFFDSWRDLKLGPNLNNK